MANSPIRSDPIRKRYFDPVEATARVSDYLFYASALLSLCIPFVDKQTHPVIYDSFLTLFALTVIALFAAGLGLRLYLLPRADDMRRRDFFTSASRVNLTPETTVGYYNNALIKPVERIAAQVFENSHFSKAIALQMVRMERIKIAGYALLWIIAIFNRSTDLGWIAAATQVVFSEQILSKWLRLEWLTMRFEKTFDDLYRLFESRPPAAKFNAMTLDSLVMYETAKANAAITLSSKVFNTRNPQLSAEWNSVRAKFNF